jgi:hypothetical protein
MVLAQNYAQGAHALILEDGPKFRVHIPKNEGKF